MDTNKIKPEERCCGYCAWFYEKEYDGIGFCAKPYSDYDSVTSSCNIWCHKYVSRKEMRHHLAVLKLHNRWRRCNESDIYRQQDPKEVGKAIDLAVDYIKTFMTL